jgi:hypothetical protein
MRYYSDDIIYAKIPKGLDITQRREWFFQLQLAMEQIERFCEGIL